MSSAPSSELDPAIAQLLRDVQAEQVERLGKDALLWLAVVPEWTSGLAELTEFPADRPVADFVDDAVRAGLCARRFEYDSQGREQLCFSMPDSVRSRLFADGALGDSRDGRRDVALDVSRRVREAIEQGVDVAPSTRRWAELAGIDELGVSAGQWLIKTVQARVGEGDTATALAWIEAGSLLAAVSGGELVSAIPRGRRRIELEYRSREDGRALRHMLRREEQIAPFRELLQRPDDESWALHYVGLGGVGKTMLMRYLGSPSGFARDEGVAPFPVARVDFDHLSPLYPATRPGQLLRELADELDLYGTSLAHGRSWGAFVESERSTFERGRSRSGADLDPLASDDFEHMIQAFAAYVATLPSPVVLVLDTCEELAKLHPVGPDVPSVEATFRILERVHDLVPSLRVVLAGRRLLARDGYGSWHVDADALPRATASLAHRPYLALHELRGFTADEVSSYLSDTRDLVPSLRSLSTILSGSLDPGTVPALLRPAGDEPRYTPFDVAMYADWIADSGELPAGSASRSQADLYVSVRIVDRLRDPEIVAALPAAVMLGRFDAPMIAPALGLAPSAVEPLLARLAEQEWIHVDYGDELDSTLYEVEPQLAPRLRGYLERGGALPGVGAVDTLATKERLATGLEELVTARRPRDLSVEYLDSALRLLPAERAAHLWQLVEERVVADGEWGWARAVTSRLLGEGEVAGALEAPLGGAVRALQIAAVRHGGDDLALQAQELWDVVEATAVSHPDDEGRERLRLRASLGRLATLRRGQEPRAADLAMLERALEDPGAPADAVVAAVEGIVERALPAIASVAVARMARRLETPDPLLAAFARSLAVRAAILEGAEPGFEPRDPHVPPGPTSQRWLDWVAPDCLDDRLRLEHLRALRYFQPATPEPSALSWRPSGGLDSIDGERLASAVLEWRLAHAPVAAEELQGLETAAPYRHGLRTRCAAHRGTSPLVISLARGWLALGNATRALAVLDSYESQALARRSDADLVDAIGRARLELSRRMRLRLPGRQSAEIRSPTEILQGGELELELAVEVLVHGVVQPEPSAGAALVQHAGWRVFIPWSVDVAVDSLRTLGTLAGEPHDSWLETALALDVVEARQASLALGAEPDATGPAPPDGRTLARAADDRRRSDTTGDVPVPPASWVRPLLRGQALGVRDVPPPRTPPRGLCELALEEGELLALRLPAAGMTLLGSAEASARAAGDPVAAAIARFSIVEVLARSSRAADRELLERELDGPARKAYEELAAVVSGLPRWDEIGDAAPESAGDWSGWISRLGEAMHANPARGVRAAPISAPTVASAPPSGDTLGAARTPRRRASILAWSMGIVAFFAAAAIATVVAPLLWALVVIVYIALVTVTPWVIIAMVAAVPVLGRRWFAAAFAVRVRIRTTGKPDEVALRATLRTQPGLRRLLSLPVYGFLARPLARVPFVGGVWRSDGRAHIVGGTRAVVDGLVPKLPRLGWICSPGALLAELRVDDELAEIDWETELGRILAQRSRGKRGPARLASWRVTEQRKPSTPAPNDGPAALSLVPAAWALLAERAWLEHEKDITVLDDRAAGASLAQPDVLHLIGRPALTSAGWQLRLDTDVEARGAATSGSADTAVPLQSLLAPTRLPLARARLVILQHEPASTPTVDDREASGMRALAAAIAGAGAPAVLVIPQLDAPAAERAIAGIAATRSWRLGTRQLLGLAEFVRRIASDDPSSSGGVVLHAPSLRTRGRAAP